MKTKLWKENWVRLNEDKIVERELDEARRHVEQLGRGKRKKIPNKKYAP